MMEVFLKVIFPIDGCINFPKHYYSYEKAQRDTGLSIMFENIEEDSCY